MSNKRRPGVEWRGVDLELMLLAWFHSVATQWRDRSTGALVQNVNQLTGLPESAVDLLPDYRALRGPALALACTPVPSGLAASMLRYHAQADLACTELATCDGCRQLDLKPKHQWTSDELDEHAGLTHAIKLAAHALAREGLIDLQPRSDDGVPHPWGEDGMTMRFGVTPKGLAEAKRVVVGTPLEGMRRGWQEALAQNERGKVPAWLTNT